MRVPLQVVGVVLLSVVAVYGHAVGKPKRTRYFSWLLLLSSVCVLAFGYADTFGWSGAVEWLFVLLQWAFFVAAVCAFERSPAQGSL